VATVNGTVSFDGPDFSPTTGHPLLRYAFTPGCRGAVVMGPSAGPNAGWPVSIFNFGFADQIADAPGSRFNLGLAAWNTDQFRISPDGSYLIAVAETGDRHANLWNMLGLSRLGAQHAYSITGNLTVSIAEDKVQAVSSTSDDWYWTLP
jgi:hypothetical protein